MKMVFLKNPFQPKVTTVDKIWPDIISIVSKNPKIKFGELYNIFGNRVGSVSVARFREALITRGIDKVRRAASGLEPRAKESQQLSEDVALGFAKARKQRAFLHLDKMHEIIDTAHEVLKKESVRVKKRKGLGFSMHLKNAASLHQIAKSTYNIDGDSGEDKARAAIAILCDFDPSESARNVTPEVTEMDVTQISTI